MPDERERTLLALNAAYYLLLPFEDRPAVGQAVDEIQNAILAICPDEAEFDRIIKDD